MLGDPATRTGDRQLPCFPRVESWNASLLKDSLFFTSVRSKQPVRFASIVSKKRRKEEEDRKVKVETQPACLSHKSLSRPLMFEAMTSALASRVIAEEVFGFPEFTERWGLRDDPW